ncbi:hypothetical protein [Parabacteroides pacaensis]|uniref:hypothetical protein n=1 Tax=Parabacteroides pacaensis TaxID=2086575 RepID=UPI000D10028D|nr:hypothetical protein [Parabacteroides pacaensis]
MKTLGILVFCLLCSLSSQAGNRWTINPDGSISWIVKENVPHSDHIEMSGLKVSTVLRYGVEADGTFSLNRSVVWPMLRTIPNNTHASLTRRFAWNIPEMITVNGQTLSGEQVEKISLNGLMTVQSNFNLSRSNKLELTRIIFPSVANPAVCEKYVLRNTGKNNLVIEIPESRSVIKTEASKGVDGSYRLIAQIIGQKAQTIKPGEEISFAVVFAGYKPDESEIKFDIDKELESRKELIAGYWDNLILETPDPVLNTMFAFAKIRGTESIYDTKGGLMHGPGGESYYAAIWANDQAEYIGPFFPYLGNETGNKASLNAYKLFAPFMNDRYEKIPSSIIAEGTDTWGGAGDRGDAAMVAYGAARYALARGCRQEAEELWPLIEWCLEYCHRNLNEGGVVASDADELEGRFPAGKANLCTSSLYYDALISAVYLGKDLKKSSSQLAKYGNEAKALRKAIDRYFAGPVEGFNTYQYYEGNDVLRSWICIPLTVGIFDRKEATIKALFSPRLWTENGLLTQAGSETFWDRSTLYALRGVYAAGETEKATEYLKFYSTQRLLGNHVPYAIEAWPEGSQRHLSAESGLYCRIVTEGMFGIRPTGLRSFTFTPRLPKEWNEMALRKIKAFQSDFDIEVVRSGEKYKVKVSSPDQNKVYFNKTIKEGTTIPIVIR